ncbi:MAG: FAD:protein FMN transferase [Candidatus Eisenbacteria bacterium]|nr:FAD:protein FMN transferase [Candidatus Eisenbacteria bacterium]
MPLRKQHLAPRMFSWWWSHRMSGMTSGATDGITIRIAPPIAPALAFLCTIWFSDLFAPAPALGASEHPSNVIQIRVGDPPVLAADTRADRLQHDDSLLVRRSCRTMGTTATVTLVRPSPASQDHSVGGSVADSLFLLARREFLRVDSLMSNWTETSEVARINRELGEAPLEIHPEVAAVVAVGLQVGEESHGAFDLTVEPLVRLWGFLGGTPALPAHRDIRATLRLVDYRRLRLADGMISVRRRSDPSFERLGVPRDRPRIDLGGIAKGYGVDNASRVLRSAGVQDALIDLSGNMVALGRPPGRDAWLIGVRDPRDRMVSLGEIQLRDRAISTSGQYEQFVAANGTTYGHILDPRTGWPVSGVLGTTVIAPDAITADAWSTAFLVLGPREARRLAKERSDLDLILVVPAAAQGRLEPVTSGAAESAAEPDGGDGTEVAENAGPIGYGSGARSPSAPDTVWVESSLRSLFQLRPDGVLILREF